MEKGFEVIQGGIWRPNIFKKFSEGVAYGGSTRLFNEKIGLPVGVPSLKIFREKDRLDFPPEQRKIAKDFLTRLLQEISPSADFYGVTKNKLAHTNKTVVVDEEFLKLPPREKIKRTLDTDGLITRIPGVTLLMTGSDCTPVAVYDPVNKAIGVFHSGWRGTAAMVASLGVQDMNFYFGSDPEKVLVSIGPSIAKEDFEVGKDVFQAFGLNYNDDELEMFFKPCGPDKWLLDQPSAIKIHLMAVLGVKEENIEISSFTTTGDNHIFTSARKEGLPNIDSSFYLLHLLKK